MQMRDMATSHAKVVAGDLWYAIRHERTVQIMLGLLVVILLCWDLPYANYVLYPFKIFVTIVHELCHALTARFTGGSIGSIEITPGLEGVTASYAGSFFNRVMTVMSGYLGTAIFGGFLIWWGRKPELAQKVLQSTGVAIVLMTLFYGGGSWFSFLSMLGIGLVVLLVARKGSQLFCHMFLLMLAVMTTVQAVDYLKSLIILSAGINGEERRGDALTMESLTGVPAIVWASIWAVISFVVLFVALWISYRRPKTIAATAGSESEESAIPPTVSFDSEGRTSGNTIRKTATVADEEMLSRTMDPDDENE